MISHVFDMEWHVGVLKLSSVEISHVKRGLKWNVMNDVEKLVNVEIFSHAWTLKWNVMSM